MHESRRYRRMKIPLQVEIQHKSIGSLLVEASDMSDGGVFLQLDECFQMELGELVTVRTLGLGEGGDEAGPPLTMRVVRRDRAGMGLAIEGEAPETVAEAKGSSEDERLTLLQSLLIINDDEQVLFCMQGDHWRLPCRQLQVGESWQDGVDLGIEQLKADSPPLNTDKLEAAIQCFPNSDQSTPCLEMLIPCRCFEAAAAAPSDSNDSYRWIDVARIEELDCKLDRTMVDNILNRV